MTKGFTPTQEQLKLLGEISELGVTEAGATPRDLYLEMFWEYETERQAFKSGEMRLEQPTEEQRMASWRRAGLAPGQKYVQKVYRDDLGQLQGVATFTPDELEEMGGWKPSETEAEWAFRDTRKIAPKEQFKAWARESAEEEQQEEQQEEALQKELISLRTIKIEKGEEIPAALKIGGAGSIFARRREIEDMLGSGVDR